MDAGADVVLAGHHHGYERFARQDVDGRADPASKEGTAGLAPELRVTTGPPPSAP